MATQQGATPQTQIPSTRSTTLSIARSKRGNTKCLPEKVGRHSKRVDAALPGKQLDSSTTDWHGGKPECWHNSGQAWQDSTRTSTESKWQRQTSAHVVKRERQWSISSSGAEGGRPSEQRCCDVTDTQRGSISFHLGGKSPADDKNWMPNKEAVRATIRFAMATGRLDAV